MADFETTYEAFLDRWPNPENKHFIRDGIFDLGLWSSASSKILFLLKEAYSDDRVFDDVRDIVRKRDKPKDQTWWRLADWAYLAQHGMQPGANLGKETEQERFTALKSTALINIKKCGGKKTTDMEEIGQIAEREGNLLFQQLDLINPDIVICGNTWESIEPLWKQRGIEVEFVYDYVRKVGSVTSSSSCIRQSRRQN